MQAIKFLQNKMGFGANQEDAGAELWIELDGKQFTKAQLIEAKRVTLDKLARELDSEKIDQLAYYVAMLDSAIGAFEPIAKAKAAAARRRQELQREDRALARAGQDEFEGNCAFIATKIMERSGRFDPTFHGMDQENKSWRLDARLLFDQLFASLSFEQARDQFNEICLAIREKNRPWVEVAPLPKYSGTPRSQRVTDICEPVAA